MATNPNENYFNPGQGGNPTVSTTPSAIPATTQGLPTVNPNAATQGVINTSTPTPTTAVTNTPTPANTYTGNSIVDALVAGGQASDFTSRAKLATTQGITNYTGTADQNTQLLQKYRAGLATAQDSGKIAPTTSGDASAQIKDITGQTTADTQAMQAGADAAKAITDKMNNDPGFQQLQQDQKDYLSSQNQQQTLQEQYTDLTKEAGIPALNTELINMKSVMNGTEQDIRNEITKAGGFATESQVMALTAARNKTMIQNYNNLLQTRDDAINQINTTMGFAKEDQANATALAKEKMDYDKQVSDYTQKMTTNAADAYNKIISTPGYGYKALYDSTGGDQHTIGLIESTLNLPQGSLAQLSQVPDSSKTQVVKLDNGQTVLINSQNGQTIKNLGGASSPGSGGTGTLSPLAQSWVTNILSGNGTLSQVPSANRNEVSVALANQPADSYSPLAASRFANAANKIVANYKDLPAYQLTAGGQIYLGRIDAAIKTPGSISDQDLLDSLTKLNTGGNAISDAQVRLVTDGKSFSDMANTLSNKFKNGGVLSDNQRTQLQTIAKAIFDSYKKQYQPIYDKAVSQMEAAGIPKAFQNLPDLNNLSAQGQQLSGGTPKGNMSNSQFVDSALKAVGQSYDQATKAVKPGNIGFIDNNTGQVLQGLPSDFDPAKYTKL